MAKGRRELLLGAHRDPFFGPVVIVGDGGKYVEAMPDAHMLLPPFSTADVRDALGRLRIAPVLAGTRGEPPFALDRFAEAAARARPPDGRGRIASRRREPGPGRHAHEDDGLAPTPSSDPQQGEGADATS